jgi:hypothetical protein
MYHLIQPPFITLKFREMAKSDLKEYFEWFQEVLPERISELERAVVTSATKYETWKPDLTRESLNPLGEWFSEQVTTRPKTEEEIRAKYALPYPEWVSNNELTNHTISLAMDLGMYLGKTLQTNNPQLHWAQILKSKNFVDYGQPVLTGFRSHLVSFNPVRIMIGLAYGISRQEKSNNDLVVVYDVWTQHAQPKAS